MPRLQIDVEEKKLRQIDELMAICGFSTKKDLINNALTLFKWAVEEKRKGHSIASVDEKTQKYRELQMPALNDAEHSTHRQHSASA